MHRFRSRLAQAIAALRIDEPEYSLWPTLSASFFYGSNRGGAAGRTGPVRHSLASMVKLGLLPTLTQTGNLVAPSMQKWPSHQRLMPTLLASHPESLRDRKGISLLPTLCARDEKGPVHTKAGSDLPQAVGGHLSPTFCEWYMGFPVGWTEPVIGSPRSATRARRNKRKSLVTSSGSSLKPTASEALNQKPEKP